MNIAFACTLRVGEICGLGWESVDVSSEAIERDDAYLKVERELTQISMVSMNALASRDVYRVFPPTIQKADPKTCLVLKSPKTASSVRKVWIPRTVAMLLADWKREQEQLKVMLGSEYYDYGMVMALPNGKPVELKLLENYLGELIKRESLPPVVFHSLRHSSVTYKLKLNNGDIKLTQGDSGHAQAMMLLHVYSRILDEDRRVGAQKFDQTFYHRESGGKPYMGIEPQAAETLSKMIETISTKPEMANLLLKLFQSAS